MKVAVMGSTQGKGGVQTHFRLLLELLLAQGHSVFAIAVGDDPATLASSRGLVACRQIAHTARTLTAKAGKWWQIRQAGFAANQFAPDVFVATAMGGSYVSVARRLPGAFKIYQEVIHTISPNDVLRRTVAEVFDAVAVQSPSMRQTFLQSVAIAKPVACLPCLTNPRTLDLVASAPRPGEVLRLAYFGRLAANKGLVPLLAAFARFRDQQAVRLDIYGDGDERANILSSIEKLRLADVVTMHGSYPGGAEYSRLLASHHALVLPSIDSEGLPLVLLEAMAHGLPFLATSVGAMPDAAIDNPDVIIVPPDEESLERGLTTLAQKLRAGEIDNLRLRRYYETHFSYTSMAAAWQEALINPAHFFRSAQARL